MRRDWTILLAVVVGASACNAICLPVRAVLSDRFAVASVRASQSQDASVNSPSNAGDIFDQVVDEDSAYESGRTLIWKIGSVRAEDPKMVLAFSPVRFAAAQTVIVLMASLAFWMRIKFPRRFLAFVAWIRYKLHLLPMAVYVLLAMLRLAFVPCTEVLRAAFGARPAILQAAVLPIWQIGTESVRYDLIFFEEFVLLSAMAGVYAVMFAIWPGLRPRWIAAR